MFMDSFGGREDAFRTIARTDVLDDTFHEGGLQK
jgi:hypothetical protein